MDFDAAVARVLEHLRSQTKATNAALTTLLGGDGALYEHVRQHLILNDLADDKGGVGLVIAAKPASPPTPTPAPKAELKEDPTGKLVPQVFISYATKDRDSAAAIVRELEERGVPCWFAPRELRDQAGSSYAAGIIEAIYSVNALLLVFSRESDKSPHVRSEVNRAFNRGIPLIPVRLEDLEPYGEMEYYLATMQRLDAFPPPLQRHLEPVINNVASIVRRRLSASTPATARDRARLTDRGLRHGLPAPSEGATSAKSKVLDAFQRANIERNPRYAAFWIGSRFAATLNLVEQMRGMPADRRVILEGALHEGASSFERLAGLKKSLLEGIAAIISSPNAPMADSIKRQFLADVYQQIESTHDTSIAGWLVVGMSVSTLWSQTRHGGRIVPLHIAVSAADKVFTDLTRTLLPMLKAEPAYVETVQRLQRRFEQNRTDMTVLAAIVEDFKIASELYLLTGATEVDLDLIQPIIEVSPLFTTYVLEKHVKAHPDDAAAQLLLAKAVGSDIFGSRLRIDPLFPLDDPEILKDNVETFATSLEATIRLEPGTDRARQASSLLQSIQRFRNPQVPVPGNAAVAPKSGLSWRADFSPAGIAGWHEFTHIGVNWSAHAGVCKGSGVGFLSTLDETWSDFTLAVDVRITSAPPDYADAGVVIRYRSGRDTAVGYHFYIQTAGIAVAQVYERRNVSRMLAGVPCPIEIGHWYRLSVVAEGPTMVFAIDGRPMCKVRDTFESTGGVALRVAKAEAEFRDLSLS